MLQQTQVKTVIPYWERWMEAMPDVRALARARPEELHRLWEGLGYYTRVRNLQRAAKIICERHGGSFPSQYEQVLALPGIGRYTAGAICSIAFNQPTPILDGNVIRVLSRLFCIEGDPRCKPVNERLWQLAGDLVKAAADQEQAAQGGVTPNPPRTKRARGASVFNQALMELGALICAPKNPGCGICPLKKDCLAALSQRVTGFPQLAPRLEATARRFVAFVIDWNGRLLVRQRPDGVVNAHLWEFPNVEVNNGATDCKEAAQLALGVAPVRLQALGVIRHSITRYRITMESFRAVVRAHRKTRAHTGGRWVARDVLEQLPFASAHRKVLRQLASNVT